MSEVPGCQEAREELAVAILRGEPLPDDVNAHVAACPPCHEEFERLTVLGPLLDASRDDDVPPVAVPDESLLRRLLAEVARRRTRRRWLAALAAAAAVVVLAVPVGTLVRNGIAPPPGSSVPGDVLIAEGTVQAKDGPAGADVHVLSNGEGRGSILVVTPWGLPGGVTCRIELIDSYGATRTVRVWTVPQGYSEGWHSRDALSVAPKEIRDVRLVDEGSGKVLLSVPVKLV